MISGYEIRSTRLTGSAQIPDDLCGELQEDLNRSLIDWWPDDLNDYILRKYQADITGKYAGMSLRNPFGKASGQLSMTTGQVLEAAEAGLGFVVLKTVIAQNPSGEKSMSAWAVPEARMVVEPITGKSGKSGWSVTWKGRGWARSFDEYLQLCRNSFEITNRSGMHVAPSVKFHLPSQMGEPWRKDEYEFTLHELQKVWRELNPAQFPMPIEKDFSPTLAGDNRGRQKALIHRWLNEIVPVIRHATGPDPIQIGLKLMNFIGDDAFQQEMLETCLKSNSKPDFLIYANRLFDADRTFEDHRGVAYGGPDLSDRNLAILEQCRNAIHETCMGISGSGDIESGRTAVEYGLRGCSSVQLHTLFQVPSPVPAGSKVGRTRRTLARLVFDPADGLVAWLSHARLHWGLKNEQGTSRWLDLSRTQPTQTT